MAKLVIDSSAWVEYLSGTEKGEEVKKYFENNELFTPTICVSEIIAKMLREGYSKEIPTLAIPARSEVCSLSFDIAKEAGELYNQLRKQRTKISLSDVICLATAKKLSAKILTFDNDFRGMKEALVL